MRIVVSICFELNSCFRREIWRGVQQYGIGSKEWALFCRPDVRVLREWRCDGLITHLSDHQGADELLALGIPLVDTSFAFPASALPRVTVDEMALGQMAATYLEARGYHHYSYFYDNLFPAPTKRGEVFQSLIQKSGFKYHKPPVRPRGDFLSKKYHPVVIKWLRELPKPVAVFVQNDPVAAWLCDFCHIEGLRVPEDISLLGIGNDEPFCLGNYPNLSSIDLPGCKIGFEAAKLLDSLMRGRKAGSSPPLKLLPPSGVVTRHSTDTCALENPALAAALFYIREHISEPFNVGDLIRASGVSRRLLEMVCRKSTKRTLLELIHSARVERAKTLLSRTSLKVDDVAVGSGFSSSFHLRRIFAKYAGTTPSGYRSRVAVLPDRRSG